MIALVTSLPAAASQLPGITLSSAGHMLRSTRLRPWTARMLPSSQKAATVAPEMCAATAIRLRELAAKISSGVAEKSAAGNTHFDMESLERTLTVFEEKLFAALLTATPDEEMMNVRAQADRELSPYRRKMAAPQIEQLQKQYVHKRLLEKYNLPRLSLFYLI